MSTEAQTAQDGSERKRRFKLPSAYTILFALIVLAALATWLIPAGAYELKQFVAQSANLSLVLAGCWHGDASLVRAGLNDVLVEPRRAPLIEGFAAVKQAALAGDAMGASISGAGPSVFAWFETEAQARAAAPAMADAFATAGFTSQTYISPVAGPAARVIA